MKVLRQFGFDASLLRSAAVAADAEAPSSTAMLFLRGAPSIIGQLVSQDTLPPDYHQVMIIWNLLIVVNLLTTITIIIITPIVMAIMLIIMMIIIPITIIVIIIIMMMIMRMIINCNSNGDIPGLDELGTCRTSPQQVMKLNVLSAWETVVC